MMFIINFIKDEVKRRKDYIRDAANENALNNFKTLRSASLMTIVLLVIFLVATPWLIRDWAPSMQHILFLPAVVILEVIIELYNKRSIKKEKEISFLCVLFEVTVLSFIVLIDAESDRGAPSSFISMMFIIFPLLFVFSFKTTYSVIGIFGILYIIAAHIWKESAFLYQHETFNAICAIAFSVFIEGIAMSIRIKEYDRRVKYEQISIRDPLLTEIYNKQSGQERIYKYLSSSHAVSAVLIVMDLDDFKQINDTYGHYKGDIVLRYAAMVLKKVFRAKDIVARFGGDEFMVLLCGGISKDELEKKCATVNRMFRKSVKEDLDIYASCSLGALVVNSQRVDSFDALFCQADRAGGGYKSHSFGC